MAVDLTKLNEAVLAPAGLMIERVRDDAGARHWLATLRSGNNLAVADVPNVPLTRFAPGGYTADEPLQLYLAILDGVPVATAQIFYAAGVAGVYCVATIPASRRRGIGTAITLAGLRAARERGYRVAVLGATAMGSSVYARLGFQRYCTLSLCEWSLSATDP
jgi:GNAT superfamily N-acetyltransferase